jgi:uncharacterized protein YndB with AHSA1/START domain
MHGTPTGVADSLFVEQFVSAQPHEVFADLTVPDRLLRWWGDRSNWWSTNAEVDLRPGGRYWLHWENTQGQKDRMGGHFKEINQNRGFVLSFVGSHDKSHTDEVAFALEPMDTGTKVILRHSGLEGRPEQYANYQRGWALILGWLARKY